METDPMSKSTGFPPEIAAALHVRDGGRCSMEGFPPCPGQTKATEDPGHRLRRGMGGDTRWFINDPMNGTAQHHGCNWRLGENDEFAEEGLRRGCVLTANGDDDEGTITRTPMWSPFFSQWVRMLPDGMHMTGITDPTLDAREHESWLS
jgi:hypothetical protein